MRDRQVALSGPESNNMPLAPSGEKYTPESILID